MSAARIDRRIAVAIAARDEAETIVDCVAALLAQASCLPVPDRLSVHVLANNCRDATVERLRRAFGGHPALHIGEVSLLDDYAHAGWARRLAMDAAAAFLRRPDDLLLATDADTIVAPHWLHRTLPYFANGFDAVAGFALVRRADWRGLDPEQDRRLRLLGQYFLLLSYLRRDRAEASDRWPNHGYEGGASIAMTAAMYAATGGCPTCAVAEDRALFEAVRRCGGKVRHALDVKVFTSGRLNGRAAGGMADTIRRWSDQPGGAPIHETWRLNAELGYAPKTSANLLTFDGLEAELAHAKALARAARAGDSFEMTG